MNSNLSTFDQRYLPPDVAHRLLKFLVSDETVVVGGQAVMFWAHYFNILEKSKSLTQDIDLYGMTREIEIADQRLVNTPHKTKYTSMDDSSPNSGLITIDIDGRKDPVIVDFLWTVEGLNGVDIQERAVSMTIDGDQPLCFHILHPLMLMESKIMNLASLPKKRTTEGVEQARLSIEIVKCHMMTLTSERYLLKVAERIFKIANTNTSHFSEIVFKLDILQALAVDYMREMKVNPSFFEIRYPQMIESHQISKDSFKRHLPAKPDIQNTSGLRFG